MSIAFIIVASMVFLAVAILSILIYVLITQIIKGFMAVYKDL